MLLFVIGVMAGLVLSIPKGPGGLLVISNSVVSKFYGRCAMFGLMSAQLMYSLFYIFGLQKWILDNNKVFVGMTLVGSVLMIALGVGCWLGADDARNLKEATRNPFWCFWQSFLVTALNPSVLFLIVATVAVIMEHVDMREHDIWYLLIGSVIGIFIWFSIVIELANIMTPKIRVIVTKISAIILVVTGVWAIFGCWN